MTWGLASFVASGLATVIGFRASIASRRSKATFGPATPTETRRKQDALRLWRLEILAHEIRQARKAHRPVKGLYSEARQITTAILEGGK